MSAMEARADLMPTASSAEEISDHFDELAADLDNNPFAIYAELASTAAAFPAEHQASMAGALSGSDNEAVREAALGFALSPDPAVSSAALVAIAQQGRAGLVSNRVVDRLVRMRPWLSERRRTKIDTAVRACVRKRHPLFLSRVGRSVASRLRCAMVQARRAFSRSPSEGAALRSHACW